MYSTTTVIAHNIFCRRTASLLVASHYPPLSQEDSGIAGATKSDAVLRRKILCAMNRNPPILKTPTPAMFHFHFSFHFHSCDVLHILAPADDLQAFHLRPSAWSHRSLPSSCAASAGPQRRRGRSCCGSTCSGDTWWPGGSFVRQAGVHRGVNGYLEAATGAHAQKGPGLLLRRVKGCLEKSKAPKLPKTCAQIGSLIRQIVR